MKKQTKKLIENFIDQKVDRISLCHGGTVLSNASGPLAGNCGNVLSMTTEDGIRGGFPYVSYGLDATCSCH